MRLTLILAAVAYVLYAAVAIACGATAILWHCWRVHVLELLLDPALDRIADWFDD